MPESNCEQNTNTQAGVPVWIVTMRQPLRPVRKLANSYWLWFVLLLLRVIGWSRTTHTFVCLGPHCLDAGVTGDKWRDTDLVIGRAKHLHRAYLIGRAPADLATPEAFRPIPREKHRSVWPTLLRLATFGFYPADDCLTTALSAIALTTGGDAPCLLTLRSLARWMEKNNLEAHDLGLRS